MLNKVKISNWDICCNKMSTALIDHFIRVSYISADKKVFTLLPDDATDDDSYFEYCPYCGGKLP